MNPIRKFLSSPVRIILFILSLVLLTVAIIMLQKSMALQLMICIVFSIFLYISRKLWLAEDVSNKLQLLLLTIGIGLTLSYTGWNPIVKEALLAIQNKYPEFTIFSKISSPFLLAVLLAVNSIISYLLNRNTILKEHPNPITTEFPEKGFKDQFKNFIKVLEIELNSIDIEINWNELNFTSLDAEVELISNNKKKRKIANLLKSIKDDQKSQTFLVLGDPGSGKSTALRMLARKILSEAERTGKFPIYINLKDWHYDKIFTEQNPVTATDIYNFVVKNFKRNKDVIASKFIDNYFDKMYENGRIFFIFDSFDEIPRVLDANEKSWIIDNLSGAFYDFLAGASESRGILASRIFRRPTKKFQTKARMEIRPFSELKIQETFAKSLGNVDKGFFKNFSQSNLLPIARNPFSAALIIQYLNDNQLKLPSTQSEIYKSYIEKRLNASEEKLQQNNISVDDIISFCTELSYLIFSSQKNGLEITVQDVQQDIAHPLRLKTKEIISILQYTKLGRLSPDNKFSFVHRRFNEYFVVLKLNEIPSLIKPESIPTDSRWRDALVLFCEIADLSYAKKIARFCWEKIKLMDYKKYKIESYDQLIPSLHCLRFLTDAFRNRKEVIEEFQQELATLIIYNLKHNDDILLKKFFVESTGLLLQPQMDKAILIALNTNYSWISEEAFKASRFLHNITPMLEESLRIYILELEPKMIIKTRKELLFSLQLSEALKRVAFLTKIKLIDSILYFIALSIICLIFPFFIFIPFLINFFTQSLNRVPNPFRNRIIVCFIAFFLSVVLRFNNQNLLTLSYTFFNGTYENYYRIYIPLTTSCLIMLLPLINLFYISKSLIGVWKEIKEFIFLFLIGLPFVILFTFLYSKVYAFEHITSIIAALFLSIIFVFFVGYLIFIHFQDWRYLRKALKPVQKNIYREDIFSILNDLYTDKAMLKFLNYLDDNAIIPLGSWPEGRLPNWQNKVSETLARQEEKWLNLDR